MTEEEAVKNWCPFVRLGRHPADGALFDNRCEPFGAVDGRCIASACMAWRWSEEKRTAAYLQAVVEHMKATGDTFNKATQEVVKRRAEFAHTEGFCGLAGAPQ